MDLSIAPEIALDNGNWRSIDPHVQDSLDLCYSLEILPYALPPQRRLLASTIESLDFGPNDYGIVCLRSTWARVGLIAPPTVVDPGFKGYLTMELFNSNLCPIIIRPGDYIWNLLIVTTPHPMLELYTGRYQNQPAGIGYPKALTEVHPLHTEERIQYTICGVYADDWEALGKSPEWKGCSLPQGHQGDHDPDRNVDAANSTNEDSH